MGCKPSTLFLNGVFIDNDEHMTDEEWGKLFRAVMRYAIDGNMPNFDDRFLNSLFNQFKRAIDHDSEKYWEKVERMKSNRYQHDITQKSDRNQQDITQKSDRNQQGIRIGLGFGKDKGEEERVGYQDQNWLEQRKLT